MGAWPSHFSSSADPTAWDAETLGGRLREAEAVTSVGWAPRRMGASGGVCSHPHPVIPLEAQPTATPEWRSLGPPAVPHFSRESTLAFQSFPSARNFLSVRHVGVDKQHLSSRTKRPSGDTDVSPTDTQVIYVLAGMGTGSSSLARLVSASRNGEKKPQSRVSLAPSKPGGRGQRRSGTLETGGLCPAGRSIFSRRD